MRKIFSGIAIICLVLMLYSCEGRNFESKASNTKQTKQSYNIKTQTKTDTISVDADGPIFSRFYRIEEFDVLEIGVSTTNDLDLIHPGMGYFAIQFAAGEKVIYPTQDGKQIYLLIDHNGSVIEIGIDDNPEKPLRVKAD